jgi:DNA-directed RNA polymerase subunit alpha
MRIRWRGLELPTRVLRDESVSNEQYGSFAVEPFERGFGTTVGNSLRRILLSSLEGSAVTHVRIAGADHEFCSLPGIYQDVTDLILNIKGIVVDVEGDEPRKLRVEHKGKGEIRAGDFQCDTGVRVGNPDHVVATATDDVTFSVDLTAKRGRGYVPATEHPDEDIELGLIPIDAVFSPVTRVRYRTEDTRVGQKTNYDRLILEVWTKGTLPPEEAVVESAKILRKHLNPFVQYFELGQAMAADEGAAAVLASPMDEELRRKLAMPLAELELSVRSNNCLESASIATVGELVSMHEHDLMQLRSFGKTSLDEVNIKLTELGLTLGMNLDAIALAGNAE